MLAGRVAQNWLQAAVTRVSSSNSSSSSLLPLEPWTALVAGFQQLHFSLLHTSSCCQADGSSGSSGSSRGHSAAGIEPSGSTAGDSSASSAEQAAADSQQPGHQIEQATPPRFATVHKRLSDTGYPESFLQAAAQQQEQQPQEAAAAPSNDSSSSETSSTISDLPMFQRQRRGKPRNGAVELPPEVLRVPLSQEAKQEQAEVTVDAYSLSRSLVGEASPGTPKLGAAAAAAEQQVGREALTAADKEALEKLVGILTKDGKKSRARRLLLDAMHIIQQQLAQGKGSA